MDRILASKAIALRQACEGLWRVIEDKEEEWMRLLEKFYDDEKVIDNVRFVDIPEIGRICYGDNMAQIRAIVGWCEMTEEELRERLKDQKASVDNIDEFIGKLNNDPKEDVMDEVDKWRREVCDQEERSRAISAKMRKLTRVLNGEMLSERETVKRKEEAKETTGKDSGGVGDVGWLMRLPPIQIQKFSGRRAEFPLFWARFEAAIGSQPLSEKQKMLYLLEVVPEKDKGILERLGFEDGAYEMAKRKFQDKYAKSEESIAALMDELLNLSCRNPTVEGQEEFWDKTMTIVEVLMKEGFADGFSLIPKMTRKFSNVAIRERITRRFAMKKQDDWKGLDEIVKDILEKEARIEHLIRRQNEQPLENTLSRVREVNYEGQRTPERYQQSGSNDPCYVCNQFGHRAATCGLPWNARRSRVTEDGRCIGCLGAGHFVSECTRSDKCNKCNRKHSRFIPCARQEGEDPRGERNCTFGQDTRQVEGRHPGRSVPLTQRDSRDVGEDRAMNVISLDDKTFASKVWDAHFQSIMDCKVRGESGEVLEARVLVDSGSEMSYIDERLAEKLKCEPVEEKIVNMRAFGKGRYEIKGKQVKMYLEDVRDGGWLTFYAMTGKESTGQSRQVRLSEQDKRCLRRLNKPIPREQEKCPDIILGGAYYMDILCEAHITDLPSKNRYIQTRVGYTVSSESLIRRRDDTVSMKLISRENSDFEEQEYTREELGEFTGRPGREPTTANETVQRNFENATSKENVDWSEMIRETLTKMVVKLQESQDSMSEKFDKVMNKFEDLTGRVERIEQSWKGVSIEMMMKTEEEKRKTISRTDGKLVPELSRMAQTIQTGCSQGLTPGREGPQRGSKSPNNVSRLEKQQMVKEATVEGERTRRVRNEKNEKGVKCPICGRDHRPEDCDQVVTGFGRRKWAKSAKRCFGCLAYGHKVADCRDKECTICSLCSLRGNHHTALCVEPEMAEYCWKRQNRGWPEVKRGHRGQERIFPGTGMRSFSRQESIRDGQLASSERMATKKKVEPVEEEEKDVGWDVERPEGSGCRGLGRKTHIENGGGTASLH